MDNLKTDKMTYTEAQQELETIVRNLQSEDCDIDRLACDTARALELLKFCREKLHATDREVKKCLQALSDGVPEA